MQFPVIRDGETMRLVASIHEEIFRALGQGVKGDALFFAGDVKFVETFGEGDH